MSKPYDGGPAFVVPHMGRTENYELEDPLHYGMSLRAWLAGQAMKGTLANPYLMEAALGAAKSTGDIDRVHEAVNNSALGYADDMIARLEKEKETENETDDDADLTRPYSDAELRKAHGEEGARILSRAGFLGPSAAASGENNPNKNPG